MTFLNSWLDHIYLNIGHCSFALNMQFNEVSKRLTSRQIEAELACYVLHRDGRYRFQQPTIGIRVERG